ncbi:MAG: DUF1552 domain-containing protein [Planctomycetota bacterium]
MRNKTQFPQTIRRRTFLLGTAATLPLPLLDSTPSWAKEMTVPSPPKRLIWLFQSNGMFPKAWNPSGWGTNCQLPTTLKPFEKHRSKMTILRNLTTAASGPHVGKCSALLTGVQVYRDPELGIYANAKSLDQWVAAKHADQINIPSLQLGIERPGQGYCSGIDTPVSYGATLSWSDHATRLMPEINPRRAFDRLFRRPSAAERQNQARWQTSILDSVIEQANDVRRSGSIGDRRKMDEYLESVRSVEKRLQQAPPSKTSRWRPTSQPTEQDLVRPDPGVSGDRQIHMRSMLDLIVLALWTDSTRVATLMMSNTLSDGDFSFLEGVDRPFHSGTSHHQNKPNKIQQYVAINRWHAQQAAYLADRLASIDEGSGTLLDNSLLFFGSSLKDGNAHSNKDLPIVMLGGCGGTIRHRGHFDCGDQRNTADLHQTTLAAFDLHQDEFNGIPTSTIGELLTA